MNIMFYTGSLDKGGAERVITNLSNYLCNNGYNVSIVVTKLNQIGYKLDEKIQVDILNTKKNQNKIIKNFLIIKNLLNSIKKNKPNVIICFINEPSIRVLFLKKFHLIDKKIKVIVSVRNDPNAIYNTTIKRHLMKYLYPKTDLLVLQTNDAKKYFEKIINKDKMVVIPNPLNESFVNEKVANIKQNKTIVTVGRLESQKNHKLLINAFSEISLKHPEYKLLIYGEGSLKTKLTQLIDELNLKDKVILKGQVDNIKDEIKTSYMFVLSSDYEGMPNALMEAMALGIPCISTDCPCGGPKFLINDKENGILVNVKDKDGLVNAINYLIDNGDIAKKIGYNAHKICDKLNPDKINKMWEKNIIRNCK